MYYHKKPLIALLLCAALLGNCRMLWAQDTSQHARKTLSEVEIATQRTPSILQTTAPTQVADRQQIERIGANQLSDVMRQMAGITLKDYGGVGGVKTVSVRGLGSQFSGLSVDGVAVNDAQNGQVDLGRYLIGNSAYISFSNGQLEDLLQSARTLSAGSMIHIESKKPHFWPGQRTHMKVGMEGGSFGYLSPSINWQQRLSKRMRLAVYGQYLQSAGNYPYRLYYTMSRNDSSSLEYRKNSQMRIGYADAHLFYDIDSARSMEAKVHYTQGYHALPGPATFYNVKSSEHSEEQLFFAQAKYCYRPDANRWQIQLMGKYQYSHDLYEDTAASSASRLIRNTYRQEEGYLSAAATYRAGNHWHLGAAVDGSLNRLLSNLSKHNEVQRGTLLATLSAQYKHPIVTITGHVLGTLVEEHGGEAQYRKLSPYIGTIVRLVDCNRWKLRARYFYKESYRVPNFNELYYFAVPRNLDPEKAQQHNLGLTLSYSASDSSGRRHIGSMLTLDGYRNRVSDKIVAMPTQNMFLWSMMNVGKVDITGVDIRLQVEGRIEGLELSISPFYSYQQALDVTQEGSKTYRHQIAYTPLHNGGADLYLTTPWVEIGYTLLVAGERYYKAQNSENTLLPSYVDQSISVARSFALRHGTLRLRAQVLNLTNEQYEIVKSYPMMGRNWKLMVNFEF